jgi:hypothetical protein
MRVRPSVVVLAVMTPAPVLPMHSHLRVSGVPGRDRRFLSTCDGEQQHFEIQRAAL